MNTEFSFLDEIFKLISANKDFPNYQAERRIDIFINYFLTRILKEYLGNESEPIYICPEFPIKKEKGNRSTKLDYLCKTENEIIFVELKTDSESFDKEQAEIYLNCNWQKRIEGLDNIISAEKRKVYKIKYNRLYEILKKYDLIESSKKIRIIYISPVPTKKIKPQIIKCISFNDFDIPL